MPDVYNPVRLSAFLVAMALACPASANKILIEDSRCAQLSAPDLANVEKELKAKAAIGADDTIECKAPSSTTASQRAYPATILLSSIGSLVCRQKNVDMLEACGKFENRTERDKCRAAERKRFTGISKFC